MEPQYRNDFMSSEADIESFRRSTVWQDILQEIGNWQTRITENLLEPTFSEGTEKMIMSKSDRTLYDEMLRANFQALERCKTVLDVIQEIIKQNKGERDGCR